jgi:hypothetical protein
MLLLVLNNFKLLPEKMRFLDLFQRFVRYYKYYMLTRVNLICCAVIFVLNILSFQQTFKNGGCHEIAGFTGFYF